MKSSPTKSILKLNSKYGWYVRIDPRYPDDELLIVEEYFDSVVGYDLDRSFVTKRLIERGLVGCEPVDAEEIDGKYHLYHLYVPGLIKEPVLTKEELLDLVDIWFDLVAAKAEQIVITNDNGKFSIGTE